MQSWIYKQGEERGEARGKALGQAGSLLRVLQARGLAVSDDARQRILACTDTAQLDTWLDRALSATSLQEVLDGR